MSVSYLFPPEDDIQVSSEALVADRFSELELVPVEPTAKRNTKAIGDLSELAVAYALARNGYVVSKPLGDSHRYDLIIDDGENLSRVQVKTGRLGKTGSIRVQFCSSHTHRGGIASRSYRGEIEYIGVFCPQTGEAYLVPERDMVEASMHLRVTPTANRQERNIRWASRYKLA
jgi:hypothetical protein